MARLANSGEMDYTHLPPSVVEVFRTWDTDGSGKIGAVELQAAANAQKQMQQANKFLKVALIGLLLIVLLLVGMMFAVLFIEAGGLVSQYPSILRQAGQTFEGPFSAVSKQICGSNYSVKGSRRYLL